MASTRTTSKGIRITNEAAEYYADKPLNRIVEGLIPYLKDGRVAYSDGEIKINGSADVHTASATPPWVDDVYLADILNMASISGVATESLWEYLAGMLNEGELLFDNGSMRVAYPEWVENIISACHDKGLPVEKTMESVIKRIEKGNL